MRSVIVALFAIFVASFSIAAQPSPDRIELTRLLNEFLAGAGTNDAGMHDRFWAEDLIYTRSAGVRVDKGEIMKSVRSAPPRKEGDPVTVYTAEDIKIQLYGDAAVVAFRLVSTTTRADGTRTVGNNLNTGTFIKRSGKWQVVAWQSTTVPPPASASETRSAAVISSPATAAKPASSTDRVYQKGPRGGCFYVNASGSKVYVDKKFCP